MTTDNPVNPQPATSHATGTARHGFDGERPQTLSFAQWSLNPTGITIPFPPPDASVSASSLRDDLRDFHKEVLERGHDSYGQPFVRPSLPTPSAPSSEYKVKQGKLTELRREDCFRIGTDHENWEEPRQTCLVTTDISVPPFERLVLATNDFWHSRVPIFRYGSSESSSAMSTIRGILSLHRKHSVQHWPGSGPGATFYVPNSQEKRAAPIADLNAWNESPGKNEACPLLRCTDNSVRGLLAMARREAGATRRRHTSSGGPPDGSAPPEVMSLWDGGAAVHIAEVFAAFLSYLDHYRVFQEPHLAPKIHRAAQLARSAPQAVKNAFKIEEIIEARDGLNYSSWVRYGGSYLNRPLDQAAGPVSVEGDGADNEQDDGGWGGDRELNGVALNVLPADADKVLEKLFAPFSPAEAMLTNYVAFGRRRVVAVSPPETPSSGRPNFVTTHHRLRTVPAPFTEREQWRSRRDSTQHSDLEKAEEPDEPEREVPLELEKDTIETPDELDIWVDLSALRLEDNSWIIGMGIRGRWAEIKINDKEAFWIAKMKDYVLPAFWQATDAELAEDQSDPPSPYTDEFLNVLRAKFPQPKFTNRQAAAQPSGEEVAASQA